MTKNDCYFVTMSTTQLPTEEDENQVVPPTKEEEEKVESAESTEIETPPASSSTMESFDLVIVGGGPAGAFSAYQLRRLHPDAKIAVFDSESSVGGAQVKDFDSKQYAASTNLKHGNWIKHMEHSGTDFDPATSTVLASVVNDLSLPVKPVLTPSDSRDIFYFHDTKYGRGPDAFQPAKSLPLSSHPELVVEQCIEAFFLDYPEERSRSPFSSKRLISMTLEDLLREYAANEERAVAALQWSGYDTFSVGSNASLAAFIDSFPYRVRKPTHKIVGGTRELSVRLLAQASVDVRHGCKVESLYVKKGGEKRLDVSVTNLDGGSERTTFSCVANAVVFALPPTALKNIERHSLANAIDQSVEEGWEAWKAPSQLSLIVKDAHLKIWCKWRRPWWTRLGIKTGSVSTSDFDATRRIQYYDSAVLAVHLTGEHATAWRDMLLNKPNRAREEIVRDLRLMHGLQEDDTRSIPDLQAASTDDSTQDPNDCVWTFWEDGGSSWRVGVNASEETRRLQRGQNLVDRVHVCGASYTTSTTGTIEGALRSVMTMLRYFGSGEAAWNAVCSGDVHEVHSALVGGADDEHVDVSTGCTLLHRACGDGSADVAELLIQRGCRVDPVDSNGSTPLHYACIGGHAEVVEILLSADADVFCVDKSGATPYDLARLQGHGKVLSTLSTRHLRRHWTRMHTAPPCQLPLAPVPRLFQETVPQMEEEEIIMLSIQKAFQRYDSDGIGSITTDDLPSLVRDLQEPMTASELQDMKLNLDITNTGMVGFQDFHAFWVGSH